MALNDLELRCLAAFRAGADPTYGQGDSANDWIAFGLDVLLHSGSRIRASRLAKDADLDYKSDGSPVTRLEERIEQELRERLKTFSPGAVVVGEETGGTLPSKGVAVAIDPVDGTWAFLSRTETLATVLAVFRDGAPVVGIVGNPVTGEIGYAARGVGTRLVQLSVLGEDDVGSSLPLPRLDSGVTLVSVQPGRSTAPVMSKLYEAWQGRSVGFVRSPGGSPSWALLEAAKGSYVYVNLWGRRPADAYDLAAGVLLVRGAGGEVTDMNGDPLDAVGHQGPLIAGVDDAARNQVSKLVREAVSG
ncbi:MAG: inositol monophosphatase family protein [Planctomycetota bacterium]|jgi:myo-inositol-1(or 4)-monophosphatase